MKVTSEKVVTAQSMGASFNSQTLLIDQIIGYNFQAVFTGTPNGTFKLQASNDDVQLFDQVINWSDVPSSAQPVVAAGDIMWNVEAAFYKWVRIVYTRTSGTGSCSVTFCAKGV